MLCSVHSDGHRNSSASILASNSQTIDIVLEKRWHLNKAEGEEQEAAGGGQSASSSNFRKQLKTLRGQLTKIDYAVLCPEAVFLIRIGGNKCYMSALLGRDQ